MSGSPWNVLVRASSPSALCAAKLRALALQIEQEESSERRCFDLVLGCAAQLCVDAAAVTVSRRGRRPASWVREVLSEALRDTA